MHEGFDLKIDLFIFFTITITFIFYKHGFKLKIMDITKIWI